MLLKVYITQKMIIIFFKLFYIKYFQLCDNSIIFTFSKIYVINTLCDKAILACVIGKSCCVIQVITHNFFGTLTPVAPIKFNVSTYHCNYQNKLQFAYKTSNFRRLLKKCDYVNSKSLEYR